MPPRARTPTGRTQPRRSPRAASRPRTPVVAAPPAQRPQVVPFAAVFGLIVAAQDGYLAWLLDFGWYLVLPALLGAAAVAGAVLTWLGRRPGWALLVVAAVLTLLGLLAVAVLFALLGGGSAFWAAVLLLVGPIGCLSLALQRPVRAWAGRRSGTRSPGGRRGPGRSR